MWLSNLLIGTVRLLVGAAPRWVGSTPTTAQRIYFANHSSHIDTIALWSALPPALRARTRPVAAADYWGSSSFRRYVVLTGLNAVLIDRTRADPDANPLDPLFHALDQGDSLIIFPEGTRQHQPLPGPFKSGLFLLAQRYPQVELIPGQYWLIGIHWYALFAVFIPVYAFLMLPALSALAEDPENFLERTAKIQWGIMVSIYCVSHAPALLLLDIPGYEGQNALLLFYLVLVVQLSDVLQYVFGKLFGRTKIVPVVSPSKTVEGFLGGAACATVIGTAMWWITPFTPIQSAAMTFTIVLMGFLGGLTLSAVKRSLGAKDWGTMIKGHGGMMDRMDSVVFAAPIFFHLTRYFFTWENSPSLRLISSASMTSTGHASW